MRYPEPKHEIRGLAFQMVSGAQARDLLPLRQGANQFLSPKTSGADSSASLACSEELEQLRRSPPEWRGGINGYLMTVGQQTSGRSPGSECPSFASHEFARVVQV